MSNSVTNIGQVFFLRKKNRIQMMNERSVLLICYKEKKISRESQNSWKVIFVSMKKKIERKKFRKNIMEFFFTTKKTKNMCQEQ